MPCPNVKVCLCPNVTCPHHAKCCECVVHHRDRGHIPNCFKIANATATSRQEAEAK